MSTPDKRRQVAELIDSVRSLFHLLREVGTAAHSEVAITASMRGVMESLSRSGPSTVSRMARSRPVSRQHIQRIVDELRARDLVRLEANPNHKRSPVVVLTDRGAHLFANMMRTEVDLMDRVASHLDMEEMRTAVAALSHLKSALTRVAAGKSRRRSGQRIPER